MKTTLGLHEKEYSKHFLERVLCFCYVSLKLVLHPTVMNFAATEVGEVGSRRKAGPRCATAQPGVKGRHTGLCVSYEVGTLSGTCPMDSLGEQAVCSKCHPRFNTLVSFLGGSARTEREKSDLTFS